MEFGSENGVTWNWHELDQSLPKEPQYEISPWMEDTTNQEDISYLINDTNATPVKPCVDAQWNVTDSHDLMKEYDEGRVFSSQAKRRRILQFNDEPVEFSLRTEDLPPSFLEPKPGEETMESLLPEVSPWNEFVPNLNFDLTERDQWLAELLNDTDMNSEDMTLSAPSDVQFSISDFCEIQTSQKEVPYNQKCEISASIQAPKTPNGKVIFKGRTSYMKTSSKIPSCVAYPFTFIKPCPIKGGITLQDINRKILAPTKRHPVAPNLLRSAISGKLVVGKTRIRTGGKGSITITRTRG